MASKTLPGTIYQNGRKDPKTGQNRGRWWWKVTLPDDTATERQIPLAPRGSRFATRDRDVAEQVTWELYRAALLRANPQPTSWDGTVAGLAAAYIAHAKEYYAGSKEAATVEYSLGHLITMYTTLRVEDFGPLKLKEARVKLEEMTRQRGEATEPAFARREINRRVGIWKRAIRWGVENEMLPASVLTALQAVPGLRKHKSRARETDKVRPVDEQHVLAVLPHASPVVADMMRLQLLTGMRSGELVLLKPRDLDRGGEVWIYTPTLAGRPRHKGDHLENDTGRPVRIGPRGQQILEPYLVDRPPHVYCFSPDESFEKILQKREAARVTPRGPGRHERGSNRVENPRRRPGDHYTTQSYRKAVEWAIRKCNRDRKAKIDDAKAKGESVTISLVPPFHPHQIRHTLGTKVRRVMGQNGLEASKAVLGHRHTDATEIYAERDQQLAIQAMREIG